MYRRVGLPITLLFLFVMLWAFPMNAPCSGNGDCQIIVSGTALPATPNPPCTPWGLWVWSQNAPNGYGNDGRGEHVLLRRHKRLFRSRLATWCTVTLVVS